MGPLVDFAVPDHGKFCGGWRDYGTIWGVIRFFFSLFGKAYYGGCLLYVYSIYVGSTLRSGWDNRLNFIFMRSPSSDNQEDHMPVPVGNVLGTASTVLGAGRHLGTK